MMANPDLEEMLAPWHSVARYSVYRTEGYGSPDGEARKILHAGLPFQDARSKETEAHRLLQLEPGYRPDVMSRPLIGIELENPEATRIAYRTLRQAA